MPAAKDPSRNTFPLPLLVCVALMVSGVGGARYWETATGVSYWAWLACGLLPLAAGALIYRKVKRPVDFLGSRPEPEGVKRPGLGGLLASLLLFLMPQLVGDGAATLALNSGANVFAAAVTATLVPSAVVVLGYRVAETALNRRDAATAAGPSQT
jgi:H+/Cl- antiporter ClcA